MLKKASDTRFLEWKVNNSASHIEKLIERLPWQQFKGTKRMVCSLGKSYGYSDHVTIGHSFDYYPPIKALMDKLNAELGTNFNSVLVNWYPKDTYVGIGFHKDNESDLVVGQPVASVSLGESCIFKFKDTYKGDPTETLAVTLEDSSVFVMGSNCQRYYYHGIDYKQMEFDRISLTFRQFKD